MILGRTKNRHLIRLVMDLPDGQFPDFRNYLVAETKARFFFHYFKSCLFVQMSGSKEMTLSPEFHFRITVAFRKANAFFDEFLADSQSPRFWLHQQAAKLRDSVAGIHDCHGA